MDESATELTVVFMYAPCISSVSVCDVAMSLVMAKFAEDITVERDVVAYCCMSVVLKVVVSLTLSAVLVASTFSSVVECVSLVLELVVPISLSVVLFA